MDTGFVLHQSLCPPRCPQAGVKEVLAIFWGWQSLKRWTGAAPRHPRGGLGDEHRRGEEKVAKEEDTANDGARSWDHSLSATGLASPRSTGSARGDNCQDTSDPESKGCTPKIRNTLLDV